MSDHLVSQIAAQTQIHENGPWMIPERALMPNGEESGHVAVIGVGGSTLRLTVVDVGEGKATSTEIFSCQIPEIVKQDLGFFDWCVANLIPYIELDVAVSGSEKPTVALSWSFPLVNESIIASMGKDFSREFDGKDVLLLFNQRLAPRFEVSSVTHDGTASLISGMFISKQCRMSLTLGTGVNINLLTHKDGSPVFVNSEISMLGRPDLKPHPTLDTKSYDYLTDATARFQPFEARVGGMWLGRLASAALNKDIGTRDVWKILAKGDKISPEYLISLEIVQRAASLVASVIYGLIQRFVQLDQERNVDVAYTGGVIFEPIFRSFLEKPLQVLAETRNFTVTLVPQRFGSEVGCAIASLIASQK